MAELSYVTAGAEVGQTRRDRNLFRLARGLALLPMGLGVGIVLLYFLFDWDWLVAAGLFLLPVGTGIVVLGLAATAVWAIKSEWLAGLPRDERAGRVIGMGLLQLANFGVALVCALVGAGLEGRPRTLVSVQNDTGAVIDRCAITTRWRTSEAAKLGQGAWHQDRFRTNWMGQMQIEVEQGGKKSRFMPKAPLAEHGLRLKINPDLTMEEDWYPVSD